MTVGLPVSKVIAITVNLSPLAAQYANFNSCLIIGNSNIIDVGQRYRTYSGIAAVATDFGTSAPEYLAALNFFSQSPQPTSLYIGRWAQAATTGWLFCGVMTAAVQATTLAALALIAAGSLKIQINGGAVTNIPNIVLTGVASMNAVATAITTQLTAQAIAATCQWNATIGQFQFFTTATGATATVAALTTGSTGTDISATILGTASTLSRIVNGIAAESAVSCVTTFDTLSFQWYAMMFASTNIVTADHLAIAAYIEADGVNNPHIYALTVQDPNATLTTDVTSVGYQLWVLNYNRTTYQYSSTSAYAVASYLGRFVTVNFNGNFTTITGMYKQEPGVAAETLTTTQSAALDAHNYNYFALFNNSTNIVVNAKQASGIFTDEMWGLDWLANQIQTNVYNLLFTSTTKIPQTDDGNALIGAQIEAACAASVTNGLLAPGIWQSQGFGAIVQGQFLPKGYYVYIPPISTQSLPLRQSRQSVNFQVAVKEAGAIHDVAITINVNR